MECERVSKLTDEGILRPNNTVSVSAEERDVFLEGGLLALLALLRVSLSRVAIVAATVLEVA